MIPAAEELLGFFRGVQPPRPPLADQERRNPGSHASQRTPRCPSRHRLSMPPSQNSPVLRHAHTRVLRALLSLRLLRSAQ
eukprot:2615241-Prymnesium_polylepis.2